MQAGEVIGDAGDPKVHLVKGFIHGEMEYTYGKSVVAAVNPVGATVYNIYIYMYIYVYI